MAKTVYKRKRTKAGMRCFKHTTATKKIQAPMAKCAGSAKRKGTAKRKSGKGSIAKGAKCVTPAFMMKMGKVGVRCACVVKNKSGTPVPRLLKMSNSKCSGGMPGPMSFKAAKSRFAGPSRRAPFPKAKW